MHFIFMKGADNSISLCHFTPRIVLEQYMNIMGYFHQSIDCFETLLEKKNMTN